MRWMNPVVLRQSQHVVLRIQTEQRTNCSCANCCVQRVQREIDTEEFTAHFRQYGEIEDAAIVSDGTGLSRGFGFVTYSDPICIEKALIVKHVLRDRQVDCKRAVPKEDIVNSRPQFPVRRLPCLAC